MLLFIAEVAPVDEATPVDAAAPAASTLQAHPLDHSKPIGRADPGTTQQSTVALDKMQQNDYKETLSRKTLLPNELDLQLRQVFARGQDVEHGGLSAGTTRSSALSQA